MNANELANNLDKHYDFKKKFPQTADDVIIMLRQQQAEIANLKAGLLSHHDIYPLKELTDEEITSLFRVSSDHIEFARAILKKAQEK